MTTIPELIDELSSDIQGAFDELIKLILRKTLRPVLNPLKSDVKRVYNPYTKKYEKNYIGYDPDDSINKYEYSLTNDCLGWTNDAITSFKATARFIKNTFPQRKPATINRNSKLPRGNVAYSSREQKFYFDTYKDNTTFAYKNFIEYVLARNMQNIISNRRAALVYICDVKYTDCFKELNLIGKDIINQTDASIPPLDSAKMSTARLRIALTKLNDDLTSLSSNDSNIYCSYLEMIKLINSVDRSKMIWVINLIGNLAFQTWDEFSPVYKDQYIEALGQCFINEFNNNQLVTALLQSNNSELILTSSYFYSLLKMLFVMFGYNNLTNISINDCISANNNTINEKMEKHYSKYRAATKLRTGTTECPIICEEECPVICNEIDPCVYEYIDMFNELYPTINCILGGYDCLPPSDDCGCIPNDYNCLNTIKEYLWRFNDFSYCKYLDYVNSKRLTSSLNLKINDKIRYLKTL